MTEKRTRVRRRRSKHRPKRFIFLALMVFIITIPTLGVYLLYMTFNSDRYHVAKYDSPEASDTPQNVRLSYVKSNIWVKLSQLPGSSWRRQAHAGIAYDSKRGNILLFGSDTHDTNWDNEIHIFNPTKEQWTSHYKSSIKKNYRVDEQGYGIVQDGKYEVRPWAMHTFDNIVYDPIIDALFVTAQPKHNPMKKKIANITGYPMWRYDLETQSWQRLINTKQPLPELFAGATAYDAKRDVIMAYKSGVWELGPDRQLWQQASTEKHHQIHYNMEYDSKHHRMVVFGDYKNTNVVWSYAPGEQVGSQGQWQQHLPEGDIPPEDQHFPVAFDNDNGVFLLVPDNNKFEQLDGERVLFKGKSSSTFVFDLETNFYIKVPKANLPALGMNYMMVYEKIHKTFLLVTGDENVSPAVWAFKLDLNQLTKQLNL